MDPPNGLMRAIAPEFHDIGGAFGADLVLFDTVGVPVRVAVSYQCDPLSRPGYTGGQQEPRSGESRHLVERDGTGEALGRRQSRSIAGV